MRGGIVVTEGQEGAEKTLNNDEPQINKGVELLLRNRRKKLDQPKTFQIKFGNMISIFKRDIVFHFNFYLDVRKK